MTTPLIHFVHGKESGPWGTKIVHLSKLARNAGFDIDSLDYSGIDDPQARAAKLVAACRGVSAPLILVGSSMGGWVAAAASREVPVQGLFLLAPAFYLPGYPGVDTPCPGENIEIVHGWRDDVILFEHSIRFGQMQGCTVHLVDDGHRLLEKLDLVSDYFSAFLKRLPII